MDNHKVLCSGLAEECGRARFFAGPSIFHPLRWSPQEAFGFLGDVPELERAGVVVRMPATWRDGRPPRPQVQSTIGGTAPAGLGKDALLDFSMKISLDGETLSPAEVKALLAGTQGMALLRGQWVEVDQERLGRMMERFAQAERLAASGGLGFAEALRLLAGADIVEDDADGGGDPEWSRVVAGPWLAETLKGLRSPEGLAHVDPGRDLRGTLRPYQQVGVRWLHLLGRLGLGACLADDMGLGKTIQVLALLLVRRGKAGTKRVPSLLVAPASLLANWAAKIERFAPALTAMIAHASAMPADELKALTPDNLAEQDLVITSYGTLLRRFQEDESVAFFVLSLKAGGSGLNLTAASVHFDRWWNPAVENQATDRAFRIGQTKNVLLSSSARGPSRKRSTH